MLFTLGTSALDVGRGNMYLSQGPLFVISTYDHDRSLWATVAIFVRRDLAEEYCRDKGYNLERCLQKITFGNVDD